MIIEDDDEAPFPAPVSSGIVSYSLGLDSPAIPSTAQPTHVTPASPTLHHDKSIMNRPQSNTSSTQTTIASSGSSNTSSASSSRGGFFSKLRRNMSSATTSSSSRNLNPKRSIDMEENEQFCRRDEGCNSRVFGFVPSFPTPPKYIWVHAHKKKNREFTRMFLSQELSIENAPSPSVISDDNSSASSNPQRFGHHRRSSSTESAKSTPTSEKKGDPKRKAIWCAKFSYDGQYLATAGNDGVIRIWKVLSDTHDRELFELATNETSDEEADLLQSATNILQQQYHPSQSPLLGPTYLSTSNSIPNNPKAHRRGSMRSGNNRKKPIVSAPVFLPKPIIEYTGHTQGVLDLVWSKNNFLLSASKDKTVRLWHVQLPSAIKTFVHNDFVTSIAFHPTDDRFFLSGSLDCKVRLWSIPETKVEYMREAPDYIMAVAFDPRADVVVAGCFGGQCLFYDTTGLRQRKQMIVRSAHGKNSNGSRITGIQIKTIPKRYDPAMAFDSTKLGEVDDSTYRNETKLLVSTGDSRIRMYNLHSCQLEAKFKGHTAFEGQIRAFFSDTGDYIVSGSEDEKTYIWRTRGGIPGNTKTTVPDESSRTRESYEYFHSNKSVVTVSLFAPAAARTLLYNSRDPIYDLTAPPPVILTPSSTNDDLDSGGSHLQAAIPSPDISALQKINSPLDGNIIVTCDEVGVIKVFRQDSAYERRKLASDTASMIQKKRISGISLSPTQSWRSHTVVDTSSQSGIYYTDSALGRHATLPAMAAVSALKNPINATVNSNSRSSSRSSSRTRFAGTAPAQPHELGYGQQQFGSSTNLGATNRPQSLSRFSPVRSATTPSTGTQPPVLVVTDGINVSPAVVVPPARAATIRSSSSGPNPHSGSNSSSSNSGQGMGRSMSFSPSSATGNGGGATRPSRRPVFESSPLQQSHTHLSTRQPAQPVYRHQTQRAESPSSVTSLDLFSPRQVIAQALGSSGGSGYTSSGSSSTHSASTTEHPQAYGLTSSPPNAPPQQQTIRMVPSRGRVQSSPSPPLRNISNTVDQAPEQFIQCANCGGSDFKVRATARGPAMTCTRCGTVNQS